MKLLLEGKPYLLCSIFPSRGVVLKCLSCKPGLDDQQGISPFSSAFALVKTLA